ncbi:MAG: PASTA domain-containing protein [Peptococcaceae bacterium]|nr:PASTA domain-containing protein [Peptococcaceae bacterium]
MSDFLDQFCQSAYSGNRTNQGGAEHRILQTHRAATTHHAAITAPEHEMEEDRGYSTRKVIRYIIIAGTILLVAVIIFFATTLMNQVTLKNFVGTSINDAKTWGISNKISIEIETIFSLDQENDFIISQSQDSGIKVQKGSVLAFQVSKGPDPDERIELPDFTKMTTPQVTEWKSQYKANNANIMQEPNETLEPGQFIRMEFNNTSVNAANYTRKDGLLIYMSKGLAEKNIAVPDFKEKPKTEVTAWAKQHDIEAEFTEASSDKAPKDMIISQSIEPGEKIAAKTKMSFEVSIGKAVIVPDFSRMDKEDAEKQTDLSVTVKTHYSATVAYGALISQSVPAGRKLTDESPKVTVVYSEGLPYMDDLAGKNEKDLQAYFYEFTSKGANITYSITYVNSEEPKGQVVWMSVKSQFVGMNTHVMIHVSRGEARR